MRVNSFTLAHRRRVETHPPRSRNRAWERSRRFWRLSSTFLIAEGGTGRVLGVAATLEGALIDVDGERVCVHVQQHVGSNHTQVANVAVQPFNTGLREQAPKCTLTTSCSLPRPQG